MKDTLDQESVQRVASAALQRMKTAGEVRFIKDRGGDTKEWAWGTPPPLNRELDPDYKFELRNLEPLARTLRSTLMALGHVQSAYNTFTKIKSRNISPDGSLGGRGYIQKITDIRRQFMNCSEVLSSVSDTIYDEIQAPHWHPDMAEGEVDPRERQEVMEIMTDVQEIKENPEQWAEGEEQEMDAENEAEGGSEGPQPEMGRKASVLVAADWLSAYVRWASTYIDLLMGELDVVHDDWLADPEGLFKSVVRFINSHPQPAAARPPRGRKDEPQGRTGAAYRQLVHRLVSVETQIREFAGRGVIPSPDEVDDMRGTLAEAKVFLRVLRQGMGAQKLAHMYMARRDT